MLRDVPWVPFINMVKNFFPVWISNNAASKVWDEITYPFPNFNGGTVEVWEWLSNFIRHFIIDVIIYPRWDLS